MNQFWIMQAFKNLDLKQSLVLKNTYNLVSYPYRPRPRPPPRPRLCQSRSEVIRQLDNHRLVLFLVCLLYSPFVPDLQGRFRL